MSKKPFDCVEQQHLGGARVRRRLRGKTTAQQVEYWRRRTEELRVLQDTLRREAAEKPQPVAAVKEQPAPYRSRRQARPR